MSDDLRYREFAPPAALGMYVRCIWRMAGPASLAPPEPIVPDGCAEIVVNLADPFVRHTAAGSHHQPLALVAGQITRAITIQPSGRVSLWGVRFQPWGAASFLGFSGVEMQDCLTSLDDLLRDLARDVEKVSAAHTDEEQLSALVSALMRRVTRARSLDDRLPRLMKIVTARREPFTVHGVAAHVGVSTRRLQSLFRDDIGLSPKQLHRIDRFQHALALRREHPRLTWSAVAMGAGYYDQAHLIHDARDIAGCTPAALVGDDHQLTEAFLSG